MNISSLPESQLGSQAENENYETEIWEKITTFVFQQEYEQLEQ